LPWISVKRGAEAVVAADRAIEREARRVIQARREAERKLLNDTERKMAQGAGARPGP
jgi:hypothetical protein